MAQYPALRETIRLVASRVLSDAVDQTTVKMKDILLREKDPFTMNDFLQQWVNKLKFDRYDYLVTFIFLSFFYS